MKIGEKIRNTIITALFAAFIFIATAYILHIPIPGTTGYIHLGDALIYFAACFLPLPYAATAAIIGAGLADYLFAQIYILPTIIIKSLMAIWFTHRTPKFINTRNVAGVCIAAIIMVGGYYIAEIVILGSFEAPLVSVPMNALQGIMNAAAFIILGSIMDMFKVKERISEMR